MTYSIRIKHTAEQALERLPKGDRERVDQKISSLAQEPRPSGAIPLKGGGKGLWRIRVGDWRIIYQIRDEELIVLVVTIANRREVYRGL